MALFTFSRLLWVGITLLKGEQGHKIEESLSVPFMVWDNKKLLS